MTDIWDRYEELQEENKQLERRLFATSWERMVLLASYVGAADQWSERWRSACIGFNEVRSHAYGLAWPIDTSSFTEGRF